MNAQGGSFLQFRCDEKGFLSICAFGLPGHTHEDNPARGIKAAHKIIEDMREIHEVESIEPCTLIKYCLRLATKSCI